MVTCSISREDQFPTSTQAQQGREAFGSGIDSIRQTEVDTWVGYMPLPSEAGDAQEMTHTEIHIGTHKSKETHEACTDRDHTPT